MVSSPPSRQGRSPAELVLAGSSIYALVSLLSDPHHCSLVKFTEYTNTYKFLRIYALESRLSHPPFNLTILLYYYITAYMYVVRYSVNLTREQCGGSDRRLTRA